MCDDALNTGWSTEGGGDKIEEIIRELQVANTAKILDLKADGIRTVIYNLERWMEEVYAKEKYGADGEGDANPTPDPTEEATPQWTYTTEEMEDTKTVIDTERGHIDISISLPVTAMMTD